LSGSSTSAPPKLSSFDLRVRDLFAARIGDDDRELAGRGAMAVRSRTTALTCTVSPGRYTPRGRTRSPSIHIR
jgi:hypothetical protein